MHLSGKVALVTGAASGIGRATALVLSRHGVSVVVVDLDAVGAFAVVDEIRSLNGSAIAVHADVSQPDDIRRMFMAARGEYGGVDIVHNNAGLVSGEPLWPNGSLERTALVVSVNLAGVAMGTQQGIIELRRRGGGVIINTASVAGLAPLPYDPVYSATKAGVIRLVESCAGLSNEGIRVNAVLPGMVDTAIVNHTGDGTRPADWLLPVLASTRLLSAEEVAAIVVELVRDDAAAGQCRVVTS